MAQLKRCMVPLCYNTSDMMPDKIFIHVPRDYKRRLLWFEAVGKDAVKKRLSLTTTLYCCEDHFDLREDTENFLEHRLVGCRLRTKKDALPHIFDCQRLSRTPSPTDVHEDVFAKVDRPRGSDVGTSSKMEVGVGIDGPKIKEEPEWSGNAEYSPLFAHVQVDRAGEGAFGRPGEKEGGVKREPVSEADPLSVPDDPAADDSGSLAQPEQVNVKQEPPDHDSGSLAQPEQEPPDHDSGSLAQPEQVNVKQEPPDHGDGETEDEVVHYVDVDPFLLPTTRSGGGDSPSVADLAREDVKVEPIELGDPDPSTASVGNGSARGASSDGPTRLRTDAPSRPADERGRSVTKETVLTSMSMLEHHLQLHSAGRSGERTTEDPPVPESVARPHSCDVCGRRFSFRCNLKTHLRTHSGERPHKCGQCGQGFVQAVHLAKHAVTHSGERPYVCSVCRRAFTQSSSLRNHMRLHSGERPYECGLCGRRFRQRSVLTFHLSTHTDGRPHGCPVCGRNFAKSSSLFKHMGVHTGERPYGCELCGQKYARRTELVAHARSHTGERPYECATCGRRYGSKLGLSMHVRSHTGERPYKCEICNKSYARPSVFAVHKRIHACGKKYGCQSCGKSYLRRSDLTKHARACP